MRHFLKTRFMNMKISRKISCCMIFLVLTSSILLAWSCAHAYSTQYIRQVEAQVSAMFDTASLTLQDNISHLYRSISAIASNPAVSTVYYKKQSNEKSSAYLRNLNVLDGLFTTFLQNNSWAENIALLSPGGEVYSTYQNGWNYTTDQFAEELSQDSIAWLPARENVFVRKSFYSFFLPSLCSCLGLAIGGLADCVVILRPAVFYIYDGVRYVTHADGANVYYNSMTADYILELIKERNTDK